MKSYHGILIAGLMTLCLTACSSMNGSSHVGSADTAAAAADPTNGSAGGGADNSMGSNAGTGNSGVQSNNR